MNINTRRIILVLLAWMLLSFPQAHAATPFPTRVLHVGDSVIWDYPGMTTVATGDPSVVDILPLSTHGLLVNAKSAGRTTLVIYDKQGRHAIEVIVKSDPAQWQKAAAQIQKEIGLPTVTAHAIRSVILLEGTVTSSLAAERAADIAGIYAPDVKNLIQVVPETSGPTLAQTYADLINQTWANKGITAQVMDSHTIALTGTYTPPVAEPAAPAAEPLETNDLTTANPLKPRKRAPEVRITKRRLQREVMRSDPLSSMIASLPLGLTVVNLIQFGDRPVQQVLVRAKIIDINRDSLNQLGVRWGTLSLSTSKSGQDYALQPQPILFGQSPGNLFNNPLSGGGLLNRFYPLAATLSALITANKARILSEPSLLVRDGAVGSMLVGGEIPVPVAQSSSGFAGANVSVEYKPYGVRLQIQPTIVGPGTIELTASPEVSDLDYGNGVSFNGLSIPALTVRQATTTLQMQDGQTLAIGGLYSSTESKRVERIPLISQIPIIGEFFRYTENRRQDSELLILLSVQIVAANSPEVQPPASGSRDNPAISRPDVPPGTFQDHFPTVPLRRSHRLNPPEAPINLPALPKQEGAP